jgi:hypothetical protein
MMGRWGDAEIEKFDYFVTGVTDSPRFVLS